ncbi:MAG: sortase [Ilumatobacteraceae bacterium]
MNESIDTTGGTIDDAAVIARLRSALDEVTASPVAERPRMAEAARSSVGAGRWLAIAAAIALVGGGVTVIVVNRNHHAATPADSTPTAPTVPTEPTLIRTVVPWFVLNSPDMQRGEEVFEQCCDPNANLLMAWRSGDQYLTMTEALGEFAAPDATGRLVVPIDGGLLLFDSVGLTDEERDTLARAVVPGSGVPYVLPMEGWGMVGFGYSDTGSLRSQLYTALNQPPESSLLPTATITVGEYRGELESVARFTSVEPTTIAGYDGWKLSNRDDSVIVVWRTDDGSWATLRIDAALAERTDGLIAAVSEVPQGDDPVLEPLPVPSVEEGTIPTIEGSEPVITGDALPLYDMTQIDPAVGMPAPAVVGYDFLGNEVDIDPTQGAHLVVFAAHWCPHCNAEMPRLIAAIDDGTIPSWLPVTLVSTAESVASANYPPAEWLASRGWTGRTIQDGPQGDGAPGTIAEAYGTTGFPYFVLIDDSGNIAARAAGEMTAEDLATFVGDLPTPEALGQLQIPSIDLDLVVVAQGNSFDDAKKKGPVLVAGPVPGTAGDVGVVWGERTTYGAPFERLDELQAGDTITWTDENGTVTLEVISVATSDDPDAGVVPDGTTLQLRTFTPEYTSAQVLVVYARTVA